MAYNKKIWKNRVSDFPTRRIITPVGQGDAFTAEIERNEGTITEEGDPFNAATMNDLENRIEEGIGAGSAIIAGIEETSTASRAYSINQFLVYNNKLYRVIAAISQGASLVPNTNISETTVGAQLTSIIGTNNSQTTSINTLNGQLTSGSTHFYFDYKNGRWGWNSSAARGADTFHPFRGDSSDSTSQTVSVTLDNSSDDHIELTFNQLTRIDAIEELSVNNTGVEIAVISLTYSNNAVNLTLHYRYSGESTLSVTAKQYHAFD